MRYKEITNDYVLDEINKLKGERTTDQEKIDELINTRDNLNKLVDAEAKLNEFCQRVREHLKTCSFADKRLALDALGIKVIAEKNSIEIEGYIPINTEHSSKTFSLAEHSSRYMFTYAYSLKDKVFIEDYNTISIRSPITFVA